MANKIWRPGNALLALRDEVNRIAPKRSKRSDGILGDASHSARRSDHNPMIWDAQTGKWIVTAIDITNDPRGGMDSSKLADALIRGRDPRIKYIIDHGTITSGPLGPSPWRRRPYSGSNRHDHHVHVSVRPGKIHYDDPSDWPLPGFDGTIVADAPEVRSTPILREGASGSPVEELQRALRERGYPVTVDGQFGPAMKACVVAFQRAQRLVADGIVGPQTEKELGL